jgi:hypothetical protein
MKDTTQLAVTAALLGCAMQAAIAQTASAPEPAGQVLQESASGHGSVSLGVQDTLVNGFRLDRGPKKRIGTVRGHRVDLDLEYYVADRWSVLAGIPYISNRYRGPNPHCPTHAPPQCAKIPALNPPHPESPFLDDGSFHGAWQDFRLGMAYHADIDSYLITPSFTASIPSHDYPFFTQVAVGQRLKQYDFAATLAHQFDFSNIYYRLGYGYVISEKPLGINVNHSHFDMELGWFVSPRLDVRASCLGKFGGGLQVSDLIQRTAGNTNVVWYHHDQITAHEYDSCGGGLDYDLGDRYTLAASVQREVWGSSVFDFKYDLEVRLTRSF